MAETGKSRVAAQLEAVSQALHTTSEQLRDQQQERVGDMIDYIGDRAERTSRYLNERDSSSLIHDVEDFARQRPLFFVGGCFAFGLALGRFFKAAPPRSVSEYGSSEYDESSGHSRGGGGRMRDVETPSVTSQAGTPTGPDELTGVRTEIVTSTEEPWRPSNRYAEPVGEREASTIGPLDPSERTGEEPRSEEGGEGSVVR